MKNEKMKYYYSPSYFPIASAVRPSNVPIFHLAILYTTTYVTEHIACYVKFTINKLFFP